MNNSDQPRLDYQRIEKALSFVADNYQSQPDLAEIAASINLSEAHFQRLFKRWVGVSPKQFLQSLTLEHARRCLRSDMSVLDTAFDSGLAAPARLNELFIRIESVTPAEYKRKGSGLDVRYGYHQTPFGMCLIGVTDRGLTGLEFCDTPEPEQDQDKDQEQQQALEGMISRMPLATYTPDQKRTAKCCDRIFYSSSGIGSGGSAKALSLLVSGTPFQIKVWEALLRIPAGARVSYKQLATEVGSDKASRAIGSAVGKNPIALLIPCHRVIRGDGMLGGYHWGIARKLALLGAESAGQRVAQGLGKGGSEIAVS